MHRRLEARPAAAQEDFRAGARHQQDPGSGFASEVPGGHGPQAPQGGAGFRGPGGPEGRPAAPACSDHGDAASRACSQKS